MPITRKLKRVGESDGASYTRVLQIIDINIRLEGRFFGFIFPAYQSHLICMGNLLCGGATRPSPSGFRQPALCARTASEYADAADRESALGGWSVCLVKLGNKRNEDQERERGEKGERRETRRNEKWRKNEGQRSEDIARSI